MAGEDSSSSDGGGGVQAKPSVSSQQESHAPPTGPPQDVLDDVESAEVVLFQIKECYVYKIPPRKSAASYRADEWNINKWAWEGAMRVVSKGDECVIRLEDAKTGELFAQAPIRPDQPVPVEAVIDSSRFFVLRIEDNSGPQPPNSKASVVPGKAAASPAPAPAPSRHAFIGLGFRERPDAFDFQEAVYDHVKYLNKKKEAEKLDKEFQSRPAADYSLKDGQTIKLDIKRPKKPGTSGGLSKLKLSDKLMSGAGSPGGLPPPVAIGGLGLPLPAGPGVLSPSAGPSSSLRHGEQDMEKLSLEDSREGITDPPGIGGSRRHQNGAAAPEGDAAVDDDFGDFQAA